MPSRQKIICLHVPDNFTGVSRLDHLPTGSGEKHVEGCSILAKQDDCSSKMIQTWPGEHVEQAEGLGYSLRDCGFVVTTFSEEPLN